MDPSRTLQQLLFRGLGTTSLVAERLRGVTQAWVSSGRLDPNRHALVDDVLNSLRGENLELEKRFERCGAQPGSPAGSRSGPATGGR